MQSRCGTSDEVKEMVSQIFVSQRDISIFPSQTCIEC